MKKVDDGNKIITENIPSKQLTDPKLNIRISYKSSSLVISFILVFLSVIVKNLNVQPGWLNSILQVLADATSVCATGVIIASLTWLSDISSIFQQTILSTKEAISTDIREIKDSIDYATDLSKFPFDKLHDDQLTQLTKLTIREALERHTGSEEAISTTQTRLINELESYYTGVIDGIYRGIIYNYYSREIEIEPDKKGALHIRFRTNLSLELSFGCTNEQFFHKPVFASKEYAQTLKYHLVQIDGKEMLHDNAFRQHTDSIQEIGTNVIKYQRGWEYPLSPGTTHTLNMEHTILCHEQVYFHSAVLTYPCAHFEITCKIVGPYKDKWMIDADAFYPKGHRLDKEHRKDIIKMRINNGENEYRLVQNENTPCLLDGSAYKFVVYQVSEND